MLRSDSAFLSFPPLSFSSCFAKIAEIHRVVSNFLFVLSFSLSVYLCLCLTGRLPESLFLPRILSQTIFKGNAISSDENETFDALPPLIDHLAALISSLTNEPFLIISS